MSDSIEDLVTEGLPDPDYMKDDRYETIDAARKEGAEVIFGDAYTLQLDIDGSARDDAACALIKQFADELGIAMVERSPSKQPDHWHFFVRLAKPMAREDRIFWQAALGSDPVREGLNWIWMRSGEPGECFLIVPKGAKRHKLEGLYG